MPKLNYLRALIESFDEAKLKALVEEYAGSNKNFEAFLLEKSGKIVDTGKTYEDYRIELQKILMKCKTRRGYVKVMRLNNAGIGSFCKLLDSHFKNENFQISLWMSLALMETMHQAILMNTKYRYGNRPYRTFEKMMLKCRDQLDSSWKMDTVTRQNRKHVFQALVRCWWNERERKYDHNYFTMKNIFRYVERDEDLINIQISLQELKPKAVELDRKYASKIHQWKSVWQSYFGSDLSPDQSSVGSLYDALEKIESRVKEELEKWT